MLKEFIAKNITSASSPSSALNRASGLGRAHTGRLACSSYVYLKAFIYFKEILLNVIINYGNIKRGE